MSESVSSSSAQKSRLWQEPTAFANKLADWFTAQRRILPWREKTEAYKTVVSELMLQQTQVITALPYFERWIARWPDFASLAAADESQVLQMWEGLGYYSRARNLLKLAQTWVAAGEKPQSAEQWLAYPGVGPYTAAAIASIAFGQHSAVVDGNVVRILTRLSDDASAYTDATRAVKSVTPLAQHLIEHASNPGLHNEAMMELGATLCRKGQPQCLLCPVTEFCQGRLRGDAVCELPLIARKAAVNRVVNRAFVLDSKGEKILLCRYSAQSRRLAGLCELPQWQDFSAPAQQGNDGAEIALPAKPLLTKKRGIANENIEERIYAATAEIASKAQFLTTDAEAQAHADGDSAKADATANASKAQDQQDAAKAADKTFFWQRLDQLDGITLTGPHRRWLTALLKKQR